MKPAAKSTSLPPAAIEPYDDTCPDYLQPAFLRAIPRDGVHCIFELGCKDARDTLQLRRAFNAQVHAFECNPEVLPQARANVLWSPRVTLVQRAVWDDEGTIPFFPVTRATDEHGEITNPGASSCFRARPDYLQRYEQRDATVEAIRLDEYCRRKGISEIDLLCMDLQGAELHALRGLGDAISGVKYIISEIERKPIYYGQDLLPEVDSYLQECGFNRAVEVVRDDWFSDYLYVRST